MPLLRREARSRYGLDGLVEAAPGRIRKMAHEINERRLGGAGSYVHAGELAALPLLQDLLAGTLAEVLGDEGAALDEALAKLELEVGGDAVAELVAAFRNEFEGVPPPTGVTGREAGQREKSAPRRATLAALFVLHQLNRNPALASLRELIDDSRFPADTYASAMRVVEEAIRRATRGSSPLAGDLIDRLEAPVRAEPESIAGQLQLYLDQPTEELGVPRERLERALDTLEEERPRLPPGPAPPPPELPPFDDGPVEYARPPRGEPAWMREVVLGAKHTHVWLEQLARAGGSEISRLDQVPDRELERLARVGLTGLWLVGVWERSPASRRIKQLCGSKSVAASAYSISSYRVADDLGGDEALAELQERALEHGLRIGVDVVPNHFGLDSPWLREHPERFLGVDECPFPGYRFDGEDLSGDDRVGVYLENHYFDRSDAAVVFKRVDRETGRERFIYHGNDGTSTPWNDTAQLDYTRPDVRAAMTDLVVELAQRYRILRFDAAMTLTNLHFQRLWFPAAGSGGAVPSRSEHGMTEAAFAQLMPTEFWSDVVARVDRDAPDTLLVAEAFWLMEPYFVRRLGMHRVYNSAFMHLMREGDSPRYQALLTDTLERDPELLRRSVNFMTTPDEASAAEQFGTGNRYFGTATLLATMPGPPLLGHGQVEGLHEKYGMEYLRASFAEEPDAAMMERHAREIAPLLRERSRFAEVARLRRLDFLVPGGHVWHDVYAFASIGEGGAWLVLFNNSDREVSGVVRGSTADELAAMLHSEEGVARLTDSRLGIEIECALLEIRERGLPLNLAAWQAMVLRPPTGS